MAVSAVPDPTSANALTRVAQGLTRGVDAADQWVGDIAEQRFRRRHLSRLRSAGHPAPGAPITAMVPNDFPWRRGNCVTPLIDGRDAFEAMADAIAEARDTVHITGWSASPDFIMTRTGDPDRTLGALLEEAGRRGVTTKVLLWSGAPVPVIHPTRADGKKSLAAFNAIAGVSCALDSREYLMDCHHEKTVIIDSRVAFVGGLDLTSLNSDRWDTHEHHPRPTDGWHDVAMRATGPVVADVVEHFAQRWAATTGEHLPPAELQPATGESAVRMARTIPELVYGFAPRGDFGILHEYLTALRAAQRLIYIENQFLWAVEIVDLLVDKLRNPPSPDFRLVILLPAKAHSGQDATLGQLDRLLDADPTGQHLLAMTVQSTDPRHDIYVHAKATVVDDRWVTIGSANLNTHSLFNDTELNLVVAADDVAVQVREELWREHTGAQPTGVDPVSFIDGVLRPMAEEQLQRHAAGEPPTASIRMIAASTRRTAVALGPLSSVLLDG